MNKAFPAHLQGIAIGLSMGTIAVLGAAFHFAIIGLSIVFISVGYLLEKRLERGENDG